MRSQWVTGGHLNADFTASREGGLGYFAAALFALFAFSTRACAVVNWTHWPWPDLGLSLVFRPAPDGHSVARITRALSGSRRPRPEQP
jgi:hypothetical protein